MDFRMNESLSQFLQQTGNVREYKRALAVQMDQQGIASSVITSLLGVTPSFLSKWKGIFAEKGADGLYIKYRGSEGYLSPEQRDQTIRWLQDQQTWSVPALQTYLKTTFAVEYRSLQSYYDLMHAAGLSWKKTQAVNPKKKPEQIEERRKEIQAYFAEHMDALLRGDRHIFFVDECFVLWGDACGYVWGKRDERVTIPLTNSRVRQPYYGAVNVLTGEVHLVPYDLADSLSTTDFLLDLHLAYPDAQLTIIWDNASHHTAKVVRDFLAEMNAGQDPNDSMITCLWFAPHDPSQNPIEDIWNRAKSFVRKQWANLKTFADVKAKFEEFIAGQQFVFPKLHRYCPDLQLS
jgi:putative transposase